VKPNTRRLKGWNLEAVRHTTVHMYINRHVHMYK
jgi:hypothetical protein